MAQVKAKADDELVFLPLGGSNEIGMNFNLYGYGPEDDRKWIVVDLGITFGDQTTPGVEVILPDPTYIEDYADDILGIVLTMFDRRNRLTDQVSDDVRSCLGNLVFEAVIPRNVRLSEAPSHGKPITAYDRSCRGAEAYLALANEFLKKNT